jgi:hypothetical protein
VIGRVVACAVSVAYDLVFQLWPGLCCLHGCFYSLDYVMLLWWGHVSIHACYYATSTLASMALQWATMRGISFPVTNYPKQEVGRFYDWLPSVNFCSYSI